MAVLLLIITQIPVFSFSFGRSRGSDYSVPEGIVLGNYDLPDGTYTGEAVGFRPGLKVEITIINGELTSVEVIEHNEIGRQYWQTPINLIPGEIVKRQETEVDSVSGATATSKAIMAAVEDAVNKAI